ncbi:hypothetical protein [Scopulibacillus cellulosilyticus]|uniref:Uncharacterized protein n=1 Tax=Scopulibacillus cellulosilyticus TaxID=2665665 RepID=A0ABW2PX84_9BACL
MLRVQIGKNGTMNLKILGIAEHGKDKLDFYYKNINEPAYISKYWISLSFDGSKWNIADFCVYNTKEEAYQYVGGLFSHILTDPLIDGLISYYDSTDRKKQHFQDLIDELHGL